MILNERYWYDRETGTIKDLFESKETRLEPRQKSVFDLLLSNQNRLVTREVIEKEVWDNYGGASEGLNQAISILRKTLNDKNKSIITTIPKKGYLLKLDKIEVNSRGKATRFRKHRWLILVLFIVGILTGILYLVFSFLASGKSPDAF